jgi:hypothetical protein
MRYARLLPSFASVAFVGVFLRVEVAVATPM